MKIAIVDDEQSEIEKLTKLIGKYSFENNVEITCMTFTKGEVFLKEVLADGFDVTFLDIFLKDENGIDVAKKMRYAGDDSIIIFSTATDQYAVKSYRVRAFDYLVKPYDYDRIVEALALCQKAIVCDDKYFIVKSKRQDMKIKCKDVVYVDYYNHYVQIHTKKGIISTYSNFDDFYKNLAGQERFLPCCRNCAINMDEVQEVVSKNFTMTNGDVIAIGKRQEKEAKKAYAEYTFNKLEKAQ